ncbi:MAG: hypothetical protein K2K27_04110 [Muribaculaceae bacterium]|nr:hypothetical protein [Muribaculaceae bacterium]
MKKLHLIAIAILSVFSLTSCNEDPVPMVWEFSSYDTESVSVTYAPDYVYQISISANDDFSGEITLTCTNYPSINLETNTNDGSFINKDAGFSITKVDDRTLKLIFTPITNIGDNIHSIVSVNGNNKKENYITNISINRRE